MKLRKGVQSANAIRTPRIQVATPQQQALLQQRAEIGQGGMTVSANATINGCCGLFDLCGDADLMSLSFQGSNPFLDWIGWEASDVCKIIKNFITWVRPERSDGVPPGKVGYVGDPCGDANEVEWGTCDFTLEDFGRLRRKSPVRDITRVGLRLCENQPRYRLDGTPITDDVEFDMRLALEVLLGQDLPRYVISGNHATPGLFDGLELLVKDGYTNSHGRPCSIMDSIVVDWNGNNTDGGAGITWNGAAIAATWDLISVILSVVRRIKQRISWAPVLNAQNLGVGDIVIVGTTQFLSCLKDAYTCWSVCPAGVSPWIFLNTMEGRKYRDSLNSGQFGAGHIYVDGFEIPLIANDWLIKSTGHSDFYILTGSVGNVKTISGQYNNMAKVPNVPDAGQYYDVTDGGRLLTWVNSDGTCIQRYVEFQPRLLMWTPWANARFQDVVCNRPGGELSPDPDETSFFPETSFSVAECPSD